MSINLADSVFDGQEKNSLTANRPAGTVRPPWPMGRKRKRKPLIQRTLYLGEWLSRLGMKQVTLAKGVGVSPQYINELISGDKDNPSNGLLLDIAHYLGIPFEALYREPPNAAAATAVQGLSEETLARLRQPDDE